MEPAAFRLPAGIDGRRVAEEVGGAWDGAVLRRGRAAIAMRVSGERLSLAREWRWPWQWSGDDALQRDVLAALERLGVTPANEVAEVLRG